MPLIVGGDFNLIRSGADKNNANIDWTRVSMFNNAIAAAALREATRTGARFTRTNKQLQPVRSMLDPVFFTPEWEVLFPLCMLVAETLIGSDQVPLIFSSREDYTDIVVDFTWKRHGSNPRGLRKWSSTAG